ncbi:Semaphorin-4G [Bagarius yarrelli]|uniref:Semaphorin-4G n=1 Tax=Bagarius yarrelli TaxID=175774 RepID=A0A556TJ60_BAGYA|nr:Semaphorin-4G [Bagarius yarrelli]
MDAMTHPKLSAILLTLLCSSTSMLWGFLFGPVLEPDAIPRTTVPFNRLLDCNHFRGQTVNYSILLLEDRAGILYVGAREALFALDTANILSIRTDSSDVERFSFVRFEEGKDKCPYDPVKGYTGFIVDSEMYSASQYEFGNIPDIRRNFPFPNLKTEEAPNRWLLEADFVGSALLRESINSSIGDDDKVYFFFTERNPEQKPYSSQTRVARVARVCKSDIGGQRTLQRKWTSFLKARLVCSLPEYELQFNILRGVYVLEATDVHESLIFAIFGPEWKNVKTSVVCRYSIRDVQSAFDGPYMELQDSKWREYTGKIPDPRPGSHRSQLINSSRDLPDDVLMFAQRHPLMAKEIRPIGGRPLLFIKDTDYTRIAVHKVTALDGNMYNMIFTGTDHGWMHKAVQLGDKVHIIEELQLFEEPQPINSIVISNKQKSVYVSAAAGVVQVPLSSCLHYTSCYSCVFARDPLCGWDGGQCVEILKYSVRSTLIQDIQMGFVTHRTRSVLVGHDMLLLCELQSNLAVPYWTLNGKQLQGYSVDTGYRISTDGLLIIGAQTWHSGHYCCYAVENSVWIPIRSYMVMVQPVPPPSPHHPTDPTVLPERLFTTSTLSVSPSSEFIEQPLHPLPSRPEFHNRHMEAMYISLVAVLGGLCLVLTVVLLYVSFCAHSAPSHGKYSQHQLSISPITERKRSSHVELKTISSHCNGRTDGLYGAAPRDGQFLQIISGDEQVSPNKDPPPAPPLPMPPPLPSAEYINGLSAALPSVLRKINGNSYVLLSQLDTDMSSPLYHSFTDELNRILEKRKHTQLEMEPDESSV